MGTSTTSTAEKAQLRVVSLLPSATDLVVTCGGLDLLVGRSHECDWPPAVHKLPVLTGAINQFQSSKQMDDVVNSSLARGEGLYFLEQQRLQELKPDVIVTQDLCNVCSVDLKLVEKTIADFPVKPHIVTLNPQKLSDVLSDLTRVGKAIGLEKQSTDAVQALHERVQHAQATAQAAAEGQSPVKVAFIEWLDPLFMGGHWTPEMIRMAGGVHPLNMPIGDGGAGPSFRTSHEALVEADCDWNIVCPCGFSIADTLKEADLLTDKPWWRELRAVKAGRVVIVDGSQMFARPGPRLVDALEFLVGLLHDKPDIIPKDFPWQYWPTGSPQDHALPSTAPSTEDQNTGSRPKGKSASIAGVTSTAAETNADRIELSSMTESVKQGSVGAGMSGEGETRGSTDSVRMPNGLMSGGEGLDHTAGQQPANKSNGMLTRGFPSQSQEDQQRSPHMHGPGASQLVHENGVGQNARHAAVPQQWCAPDLGADIEEAHATAIKEHKPTYTDPATGYTVLTEQTLRQQSVCCANRCRHCPFGHFKVPAARGPRVNTITEPTLLRLNRKSPEPSDCKLALWPLTACDQQLSAETRSSEAPLQQPSTNNVPVPEPEPSSLKSLTVQPEQSGDGCCVTDGNCHKLVILVVFDSASRLVWGRSQQSLHDVLHWALLHKQMLFVLPVEGHKAGYASDAMETHLATANAILLQQA